MLSEPPPPPDCTVTVVLCVAGVVPLAPLQVRVNVVVPLSGPVLALPLVGSLTDQPPEAVQLLAFVEDQLSVADEPLVTVPGLALSESVGTSAAPGENPCPVALVAVADVLSAEPPPQPVTAATTAMQATATMLRARRTGVSAALIELRPYLGRSLRLVPRTYGAQTEQGRWETTPL